MIILTLFSMSVYGIYVGFKRSSHMGYYGILGIVFSPNNNILASTNTIYKTTIIISSKALSISIFTFNQICIYTMPNHIFFLIIGITNITI